ncbi:MAG: phosphoserine aminotransferase, partial [Bacteroidia bacterium]
LVVVKKSILGKVTRHIPTILTYQTHIDKESMFNTPSVFAVYGCLQTLKWIDKQGLSHIEKINTDKANLLYNAIDGNDSFEGTTATEDRSKMNVTFVLKDESKNAAFLDACAEAKINGIKGHRSVGGFRASMYNALGLESVQALVDVMNKF